MGETPTGRQVCGHYTDSRGQLMDRKTSLRPNEEDDGCGTLGRLREVCWEKEPVREPFVGAEAVLRRPQAVHTSGMESPFSISMDLHCVPKPLEVLICGLVSKRVLLGDFRMLRCDPGPPAKRVLV